MNKGVLLVNLGSPDSPAVPDVRRYLREFLMDGRVLDVNWFVRFCVVHFAILPSRPKESAEAYHKIWTPAGSPLVVTSRNVHAALQKRVTVPVELAMRYQNPSIPHAVKQLAEKGIDELLLIPLFPHYAMSSFESAVERVKEVAAQVAPRMRIQVEPPYFDQPDYIRALTGASADYLKEDFDHLLFSFHGIPERHLQASDPTGCHCLRVENCCGIPHPAHATCYRAQCFKTVDAFVKIFGLPREKYSVAFQSRLGKDPWLKPYTDYELSRLASAGVKKLLVICPAFVSDCLETIEEIGMRGRAAFLEAGGNDMTLIPCLNEHPLWLDALQGMVERFLGKGGSSNAGVASPHELSQNGWLGPTRTSNMNTETQSTTQNPNATAGKSVLIVGFDPTLIDFSDPAFAAFPGMNAARVMAGVTADQERLKTIGYDADICLTDFGETAEVVVLAQLKQKQFDCIMIGAGVRVFPTHFIVFEKLINLVHEHAPHARFCFNTKPTDTAEAVRRWI